MIRNKVQLIGNIGRDPEQVARTKDERPVVRFAIAQDVNGMDAATQKLVKKDSQWFQVSCFAGVAERVLGSLKKGDLVIVSGELKSRSYKAENGEKRNAVEVIAQEVFRLERLRKGSGQLSEKAGAEFSDEPDFENFEAEGTSL
jgi:single-strand DNA-binding protein